METILARFEEDLRLRGVRIDTRKSYVQHVRRFLKHIGKRPDDLSSEDIRTYLLYVTDVRKWSASPHNCCVAALKFFFWRTLRRPEVLEDIQRRRVSSRAPEVLNESLGDPTMADAICDRLVHSAHVMTLRGGSMGKKKGMGSPTEATATT